MDGLIQKVKSIIMTPKEAFASLAAQTETIQEVYTGYLAILAAVPAVVGLVLSLLLSTMFAAVAGPVGGGALFIASVIGAVVMYVVSLAMIYGLGILLENVAPSFGGVRDRTAAIRALAYAGTPVFVASIVMVIPVLGQLLAFAGALYALYLLYLAFPFFLKVAEEKSIILVLIVVGAGIGIGILFSIFSAIFHIGGGGMGMMRG